MLRQWRTTSLAALTALVATLAAAPSPAGAQAIVPQPIPPGFNFPTSQVTIDQWVSTNNTQAIRGHAWDLWAGLAAPSNQTYNGVVLPVWETWCGNEELFPAPGASPTCPLGTSGALTASASSPPRALRGFTKPHQFVHFTTALKLKGVDPNAPTQVVSFNKFDPSASDYIIKPQKGPGPNGTQTFAYNTKAGLQALNNAWPAKTSGQDRGVNDFPTLGIELKPVFSLVSAKGLSVQPVWRGSAGSTNAQNPTPDTWTTCVLIDPVGQGSVRPATPAEIAAKVTPNGANQCKTYLYGPLSTFYSFVLTAAEAAAFNNVQGPGANAGDHAVLVAMHVNTKEIPFWTWQTFWWQPGVDAPNNFPGSKQGQPATLKTPWNNYAACTAYAQTQTPGGAAMQVCFNPYLETSPGIPAGITSNCVSCHGVATISSTGGYPAAYKKPINFFNDPAYFNAKTTHTDFSWALPVNAK